jgi:site-specific DNA recombinase
MINIHKDQYIIYNRKSTDDANNQRNSLVYQRQRNLEYAQREHLPIATDLIVPGFCTNGIIDESHSAFKQEDEFVITEDGSIQYRILRPKFLTLIGLLKKRTIKGVVFLCWDRASRNEQDDLIIKKLIRLGCDIRFAETTYDKTSAGDLHRDIDGVFAAHYSRSISEKIKNAQKKLRAERRCLYNSPVGYLDKGSDNKPFDPERALLVKRIFELYATGSWSMHQLAKWAREQGLTKRPVRRKRTYEEIANNVDLASIPKISRPVDHKSIEYILKNPFYIGKIKIGDRYEDSAAHEPLIDTALFLRVQEVLKKRRVSVVYLDKPFYTYRELSRCAFCDRAYSPYLQKGSVYYRSRCKEGCQNADPNLTEKDITLALQGLLDTISFTDDELTEIEARAQKELPTISAMRGKVLADLQAKQRTILADIDYLLQNRVTLMRTASMDVETIQSEEARLSAKLALVNEEITVYTESAPEMLRFVITFSELMKNAGEHFRKALDSERREIALTVFSELRFANRRLVGHEAKDGFKALLSRISESANNDDPWPPEKCQGSWVTGAADYLFSELECIYRLAKKSLKRIEQASFFTKLSGDSQ